MWHEARKQEKKIRGMMVDYKRRAERRRDYYERIKQDPAQFLQVHGRPAKIHLDPAVAVAADSPATMMPWQGHGNNLIDRFDVRAHLDIIPEPAAPTETLKILTSEDRKTCYERYRTLVQNDYMGVGEDKFLHQIFLEERYGPVLKPFGEEEKKKLVDKKAAIGYVYEDSTPLYDISPIQQQQHQTISKSFEEEEEDEEEKDDWSDIDLDVTVDVSELTAAQGSEMNELSVKYGMVDEDFITYLMQDKDEADHLRMVKEIEEEKAMFSGRKSRRERRALREKKLAGRKITSPPSYAARDSPTYTPMRQSTSKSRSRSPPNAGKKMFITSFGGEVSDSEKKSSGSKSKETGLKKSSKESKSSKSSADIIIGPQLPDALEKTKDQPLSSSSSSKNEHKSPLNRDRDHTSSSKKHHSPQPKSRKSTRSSSYSSSNSSRSRSKSKSQKKTRDRRYRSPSSRSRSRSSRSRSRSYSRKLKSSSKSQSPSPKKSSSPHLPPPPVKSYYRHSLSHSDSDASEKECPDRRENSFGRSTSNSLTSKLQPLTGKAGPSTKSKITPQERLKRKMQLALNRQYKADKKAQLEKTEKQMQERMDRAEELRDMAIKLRQREREKRHKLRGYHHDSDSDSLPDLDLKDSDMADVETSPKQHRSRSRSTSGSSSSSSSSSPQRGVPRTSDVRSSWRSRSRSRSPIRDSQNSSSYIKKIEIHRSPIRYSPRRSPTRYSPRRNPTRYSPRRSPPHHSPRRSPPHHSPRSPPRRSPPRSFRQKSPQRTSARDSYSSEGSRRYDSRRSSSRSPRRHSSYQYSNRWEGHPRSPTRQQSSRSRNSRLVDY